MRFAAAMSPASATVKAMPEPRISSAPNVVGIGSNAAGNMITSQLSDNGGTLGITIDGSATWILTNGSNDYTGNTTVSAGALGIGHNTAIGGNIVNSNGNIFAYGGDRTISKQLTMNNNANWGYLGDYSLNFSNVVLATSGDGGATSSARAPG